MAISTHPARIAPISGHGRTSETAPTSPVRAAERPPRTRPETTTDAAMQASVSKRDSTVMNQTTGRRMAPVLCSSASSDLRPQADMPKVLAMPIAL